MRNVTMVVPVFMTSCHVSEKWNTGPVTAQTMTVKQHIRNVSGRPVAQAIRVAAFSNASSIREPFLEAVLAREGKKPGDREKRDIEDEYQLGCANLGALPSGESQQAGDQSHRDQ